ncbi:hypothetical protein BDF22DRAFT_465796 [Syncephalis plumigaleata]|nr:hypothetical protein BDF22DRAFT_465796 [Syncephalis plumigaleata]
MYNNEHNSTIAGMKRDRATFKAGDSVSKGRRDHGSTGNSRNNNNKAVPQESNTLIRKRIRDTERLLRRPKIAADVKVAAERRLKALHLQLEEGSRISLEKRRTNKYKMVRFIEEQKIRRKLEKTKKQLKQMTDTDHHDEQEISKIQHNINELEIDLNYVLVSILIQYSINNDHD